MSDTKVSDEYQSEDEQMLTLLRATSGGNLEMASQALEELFRRYAGLVYRVIKFYGVSPDVVDDLLLSVFETAYRHLSDPKNNQEHLIQSPRNWLFKIAQTNVLNYQKSLRTQARKAKLEPLTPKLAEEFASEGEVGAEVEQRETTEIILNALNTLPSTQRQVMLLYMQGFTREEIIQILSLSSSAYDMARRSAILRLRPILAEEGLFSTESS